MEIGILFQLAAVGLIVTIICQVLNKAGREDIATVVGIVGLVIALGVVVSMAGDLFEAVRRIFELA